MLNFFRIFCIFSIIFDKLTKITGIPSLILLGFQKQWEPWEQLSPHFEFSFWPKLGEKNVHFVTVRSLLQF